MTCRTRENKRVLLVIAVILLLVAGTGCAGCIKKVQQLTGGESAGTETVSSPTPTLIPAVVAATPIQSPTPVSTPVNTNTVTEVSPIISPSPYKIQHAKPINPTPLQVAFQYRQPDFTKTYSLMSGNAYGLLVNVAHGPLYIRYTVNPKYDCLSDPDSCRGTVLVPVNRPYLTITVRDNKTGQIVAQDGYARVYSSDTGNNNGYDGSDSSPSATYASVDQDENSAGYTPPAGAEDSKGNGPRYIAIYKEGQFQITIQGMYLDTTVGIITGKASDTSNSSVTATGSAVGS